MGASCNGCTCGGGCAAFGEFMNAQTELNTPVDKLRRRASSGEWRVNGSETTTAIWVEDGNGKRVCTLRNCEADADRARLIAAAPEILRLLKLVNTNEMVKRWPQVHTAICSVLAKVTQP
jgi:hypothetical protein